MSVKFAGARNVDDRRRRRMATENDTQQKSATEKHPQAGYLKIRRFQPNSEEQPRSPIASLISPGPWKIGIACLLIPLLILILQGSIAYWGQHIQPAYQLIADPAQGHAWRFIRGLMLLGCAGLCWLISWFRSASVRDFDGCFKSWYWSGWIFLLLGIAAGTDAHMVFGSIIANLSKLQVANLTTLVWCTPLMSLMIEPFRCFVREMWHCRRSWLCLSASCLSGLSFLYTRIEGPHTQNLLSAQFLFMAGWMSSVLTPALLFSALLSQVHYVMYISSDPVPRRSSWVLQGLGWSSRQVLKYTSRLISLCRETTVLLWGSFLSLIARQRENSEQARQRRAEKKKTAAAHKALEKEKASEKAANRNSQKSATPASKSRPKSPRKNPKPAESSAAREEEQAVSSETAGTDTTPAEKPRIRLKAKSPATTTNTETPPQKQQVAETKSEDSITSEPDNNASWNDWEQMLESPQGKRQKSAKPAASATIPEIITNSAEDDWDEDQEGGDSLDPEMLKGLSKKEKRKMRKMHRDQQRAKAG